MRTLLAERPFEGFSRALAVPLCALVLFMAGPCSALWSHAAARTIDGYDRTLLYVLGLTLCGSLREVRVRAQWFVRGIALASAVSLIALVSRVLPHVWPTAPGSFANRLNVTDLLERRGHVRRARPHPAPSPQLRPARAGLGLGPAAALAPGVAVTLLLTFSAARSGLRSSACSPIAC